MGNFALPCWKLPSRGYRHFPLLAISSSIFAYKRIANKFAKIKKIKNRSIQNFPRNAHVPAVQLTIVEHPTLIQSGRPCPVYWAKYNDIQAVNTLMLGFPPTNPSMMTVVVQWYIAHGVCLETEYLPINSSICPFWGIPTLTRCSEKTNIL